MKKAALTLLMLATFSYLYCANIKDMAKIQSKYGRLTVTNTFYKKEPSGYNRKIAECVCDCGNKITAHMTNLNTGHTQSCGCLLKERITKHGYSGHKLYTIWEGIVERCLNPNSKGYPGYGGRGILMDAEWREKPGVFINWCLNNGWKDGLSIERNDCNGNYEPSNCSFIPINMQQKNTRKSHRILYNGKIYTQRDLAKELGIHHTTLRYRIMKGKALKTEQEKP